MDVRPFHRVVVRAGRGETKARSWLIATVALLAITVAVGLYGYANTSGKSIGFAGLFLLPAFRYYLRYRKAIAGETQDRSVRENWQDVPEFPQEETKRECKKF